MVGGSLFMCGKDLITPFSPPRRFCEARAGLFRCQRKSRKQFSPLWRPCVVGASLFICGKDLLTPFNFRVGTCEAREGSLSGKELRESSFHRFGCPVWLMEACLCAGKT